MYPDYETQGDSLEELQENLKELFFDIESGSIPYIRHTADLIIAWNDGNWSRFLKMPDVYSYVMVALMIGTLIMN